MKERSTIAISKKLKKEFDKMKVHPRETYEDMIRRAIQGELYPSEESEASNSNKEEKENESNINR